MTAARRLLCPLALALAWAVSAAGQMPDPSWSPEARERVMLAIAGLTAEYYDDTRFTDLKFLRHDYQVDFAWGDAGPDRTEMGPQLPITMGPIEMGVDEKAADEVIMSWPSRFKGPSATSLTPGEYSVRWYGSLLAPETGTYRVAMEVGQGDRVRLVVAGQESAGQPVEVTLQKDQPAAVLIEYVHEGGSAKARLAWSGPGIGSELSTMHRDHLRRRDGAQIDDAQVTRTLTARPGDNLGQLLQQAVKLTEQGQGVKVSLAPGIYRIGEEIELRSPGRVPLIIEGTGSTREDVVLSGATIVAEPTRGDMGGWEPVQGHAGLYRHAWDYNFGPWPVPGGSVADRREMVLLTVDGVRRPLEPVLLEEFGGKRQAMTLKKYNDPRKVLKAGQFGVVEMGPDNAKKPIEGLAYKPNMHPGDDNSLFVRLPQGVSMQDVERIELATTDTVLRVIKNSVAIRNLTMEGTAGWMSTNGEIRSSALHIGDVRDDSIRIEDIELSDIVFRQNSAGALRVSQRRSKGRFGGPAAAGVMHDNIPQVRRITLRSVLFTDNGGKATQGGGFDALWENVTSQNNGWRERFAGKGDRSIGFAGQRTTIRNLVITGEPGKAFRQDHEAEHLYIVDCAFNYNTGFGMEFEVGYGPVAIVNTQMIGNGQAGLLNLNNDGVALVGCVLANNGYLEETPYRHSQVLGHSFSRGRADREASGELAGHSDSLFIYHSTLVTNQGNSANLIGFNGNAGRFKDLFVDGYEANDNLYYNPDTTKVFHTPDGFVDLGGWRKVTGEEGRSSWSPRAMQAIPSDFQRVEQADVSRWTDF